jgi:hypothetical protein
VTVTRTKHYKKWPGLKAAAKALGVNYAYLRRVCAGAVSSPALLAKFNENFDEWGQPIKRIPKQ